MTDRTRLGLFVLAAIAIAGISVGFTLVLTEGDDVQLPPGCSGADSALPGCRPVTKGVSASTVALATVIASPLGAVLVGLIAAGTASRRQREALNEERARLATQLKSERDRLGAQLTAERSRLQRQLRNERELKDLDELRKLLDLALSAMAQITKDASLITLAYTTRTQFSDPEAKEVHDARISLQEALLESVPLRVRMSTRLSEGSDLYRSFDAYCKAAERINKEAYELPAPSEQLKSKLKDKHRQMGKDTATFRSAAVKIAGFRLPPEEEESTA